MKGRGALVAIGGATVAVAIGTCAAVRCGAAPSREQSASRARAGERSSTPSRTDGRAARSRPTFDPSSLPAEESWAPVAGMSAEERAERRRRRADRAASGYERWSRYPPWSRPVAEERAQILPHHVEPVVRPLRADGRDRPRVVVRQRQDRMFVAAGETAVATIEAIEGGRPAPLEVVSAEVVKLEGTPAWAPRHVGEARFHDDGAPPDPWASDGAWSAAVAFDADALGGFAGTVELRARVRAGGEEGDVAFPFVVTGSPPARFTGAVREAVEDGSLALYAGVEVARPGRFEVMGRLYDRHGRAVALLRDARALDASSREVRLVAFGKLLRDEGAAGPFVLRDLEGWRLVEGGHPDREVMIGWPGPFTTAPLAPETFSDKEWDPPDRTRRMAELRAGTR